MSASAVTTAPSGPDCVSHCVPFVAVSTGFSPLTLATAISGCMVLVFVVSFAVYLFRRPDCLFLAGDEENPPPGDSRRVVARLNADFTKPGLDASVIQSLPVIVFPPESEARDISAKVGGFLAGGITGGVGSPLVLDDRDNNEMILSLRECAVCLGEYAAGERIKVVPACAHGFHADCIDLWLAAKTTCPICRRDLAPKTLVAPIPPIAPISPIPLITQQEDSRAEPGERGETAARGEAAERGAMETDAAESGAVETDAAERRAVETDAAERGAVETDAAERLGAAIPATSEAALRGDVVIVPIAAGA
ncbi:hypothetical protein CLOM_g21616 [Closterium sp. NIES-68]|nr:hypothetical protein CLOM_g21616 [Closterium sp. NIES-68]GJP72938.1 hypothetical protein CLOP_g3706 [Closterium sp. NIES-67]